MSREEILGDDNLIILVRKDIWLVEADVLGDLKWTTLKPQSDEGHIKQGSTLIFEYIREAFFNFKLEYDQIPQKNINPEFSPLELINFMNNLKEGK